MLFRSFLKEAMMNKNYVMVLDYDLDNDYTLNDLMINVNKYLNDYKIQVYSKSFDDDTALFKLVIYSLDCDDTVRFMEENKPITISYVKDVEKSMSVKGFIKVAEKE